MNSKDDEIIERFIVLRSQDWTLVRIAAELHVSKSTLIRWSSKHHQRIANLRAVETEALSEECKLSRRRCIETLSEDVQKIRDELARRDLKDVSTTRLFMLSARLRAESSAHSGPLKLSSRANDLVGDEEQFAEFADTTVKWEV